MQSESDIAKMVKIREKSTFYSMNDVMIYLSIIQCMSGRPEKAIHLLEKIASESCVAMYNLILAWICVYFK